MASGYSRALPAPTACDGGRPRDGGRRCVGAPLLSFGPASEYGRTPCPLDDVPRLLVLGPEGQRAGGSAARRASCVASEQGMPRDVARSRIGPSLAASARRSSGVCKGKPLRTSVHGVRPPRRVSGSVAGAACRSPERLAEARVLALPDGQERVPRHVSQLPGPLAVRPHEAVGQAGATKRRRGHPARDQEGFRGVTAAQPTREGSRFAELRSGGHLAPDAGRSPTAGGGGEAAPRSSG